MEDRKTYCEHCQTETLHRYRPSPEVDGWRCSVCGEQSPMPSEPGTHQWERDEYGMIGTERRLGKYDFRAVIRVGRDEIRGKIRGYAEVTASCWLAREKATLNIVHLMVFPRLGIAPTSPCEQCYGTGQYVGVPGDTFRDCPWCGGTGYDVVGEAQRLVEVIWESARRQVMMRIGGSHER